MIAEKHLTTAQKKALEKIQSDQFTLIEGITSSGKTEIYLHAIRNIIKSSSSSSLCTKTPHPPCKGEQVPPVKGVRGFVEGCKKAIVLVPEIILTPQTTKKFKEDFKVAVLHSFLTPKQKREEIKKIANDENDEVEVIIGPRSALFAPVKNLGIIIVDEEHEPSYRQETSPRYHAREAALELARLTGAKCVLGSATPDVCTFHKFLKLDRIVHLPERIEKAKLPEVEIVDMRQELKDQNFSPFSGQMRQMIKDSLLKKKQIILFLNRRGMAKSFLCRSCGYRVLCPNCSIGMTFHKDGKLHCHYCNSQTEVPIKCPECSSEMLKPLGSGTQKIEQELKSLFPKARVLRMDRDEISAKNSHAVMYEKFAAGQADILLGTQMVAKGLHFPNVVGVGVILADVGLNRPDFRASERIFQLLVQGSGRAGRGKDPGKVVVQTYNPAHYAIKYAAKQDYKDFYEREIQYRKELNYPPFSKITLLTAFGKTDEKAYKMAKAAEIVLQKKRI